MDKSRPQPALPIARPEALARDLAAARAHDPRVSVGEGILRRMDTSGAPGLGAAAFSRRFVQRHLRLGALELTVSPYAPPQRQLSAVRQGAPMWPPAAAQQAPAPNPPIGPAGTWWTPRAAGHRPAAVPRGAARPAGAPKAAPQDPDQLPPDLKALLELHRSRGTI